MTTVHLWITGKVQGVFHRASAAQMAAKLGLSDWIKNTVDGAVEAAVNGSEETVDQFVAWCRKGPKGAEVNDIVVTPKPDDGLVGFQVIQ